MTTLRRRLPIGPLTTLLTVLLSFSNWLQADVTGSILGIVHDPTGAVVAGAVVKATNVGTNENRSASTDETGSYRFLALPVGRYTIEVTHPGFQKFLTTEIDLTVNEQRRVDVPLKVGAMEQQVEVTAASVAIETTATQLGQVIEEKKILGLPLNGRSYIDLLGLQAGVAPTTTGSMQQDRPVSGGLSAGNISVNGQRETANAFLVNGGDVSEGRNLGTAVIPNLDSIAEFRLITNSFDAEYGKFSGAIMNRALELQPDYPQTHNAIGLMYARRGDMRQAETEFRQTVSCDPDNSEAHYNLGLSLERLNRLDEAAAEFKEAIALNPRYSDARIQLGLTLSAKGDLPSAANAYRELIRLEPGIAEAHNNLGLVLLQMSDYAAARQEFRRTLELRPGFAPAVQNSELAEVCQVTQPTESVAIPHVSGSPELNTDPQSATWRRSATSMMVKDCTHRIDYPELASKVQMFWTDTDLYILFVCPYKKLNIWEPPQNDRPRNKLWDRDVVEFFLGSDWNEIRRYREFEIAPTGDWIDLAIDLSRKSYDRNWRSGWKTSARIDEKAHIWYAAARVPLRSVSEAPVKAGTRWRVNLYRIEGDGPDARRHFLCWQPTCVENHDPNHVPENFGTLLFSE